MTNQLSQIKWIRVGLTAAVVYIVSFLTVILVVTGYASYLGFQARGAPDQTMIQTFANQIAPWIGPASLILFTLLGARHVARRVESAVPLHGIILGALSGLVNLLSNGFGLISILALAVMIAAGWLGARK